MQVARIAIIGGGLSGLYAAALLEEHGIHDYILLEARDTLGGRIASVSCAPGADTADHSCDSTASAASALHRCDLGATWFWPAMHPALSELIEQLGLATFEQQEAGDMLVEQTRQRPPSRIAGYLSAPPARRLVGGMGSLIDAIRRRLTGNNLLADCRAVRLQHHEAGIDVSAQDNLGKSHTYRVAQVLLATPPRLAANTIAFEPPLPASLVKQWHSCATWMAPHAKYIAVFDEPFWRDQGLSGMARSLAGPLMEIHDASAPDGPAALFGFLGVPADVRRSMPEGVLLSACHDQLVRLFGEKARQPRVRFYKDWARDTCTAVAADQVAQTHSFIGLAPTPSEGVWRHRCIGIASEWSPAFSGYVAGAVDAAQRGVAMLIEAGKDLPDDVLNVTHRRSQEHI